MRHGVTLLVTSLLLPMAPLPRPAAPPPGQVTFRVRHFGFSWVIGTFNHWAATIDFDPEQPEQGSVTAWIEANSLDTGYPMRDADLRKRYFAVDTFPGIVFTSTKVERSGIERLKVHGDLTIGAVTKPVVLDTEVREVVKPDGVKQAFTATTTIYRQDFGIFRNTLLEKMAIVGDEVEVRIEAEGQ